MTSVNLCYDHNFDFDVANHCLKTYEVSCSYVMFVSHKKCHLDPLTEVICEIKLLILQYSTA